MFAIGRTILAPSSASPPSPPSHPSSQRCKSCHSQTFALPWSDLWCGVDRKGHITAAPHDDFFDVVSQFLAGFHVAAEQVVVHLSQVG